MQPVTITIAWDMPLVHLVARTARATDDGLPVVWTTPEGREILRIRPGRPYPVVEILGPGIGPQED